MLKSSVFLFTLCLLATACANSGANRNPDSGEDPRYFEDDREHLRPKNTKVQFPPYYIDRDYVMNVEVFENALDPNDDEELAPEGLEIEFKRGTPFRVTEQVFDPEGKAHLRLEIGGDITKNNLFIWVEKEEFAKLFQAEKGLVRKYLNSAEEVAALGEVLEFSPYQLAGVEFVPPIKARLSSKPGMRRHPILKKMKFHAGWDYAAPKGTPVKAAAKGKVTHAGKAGAYGNLIKIAHAEGYETRYAHLSKILVKAGQTVEAGTVIGQVGSTGRSTGPHLHFEKRLNGKPLTQ